MVDQLMIAIPELVVGKQSDWLQHWGTQDLVDEGAKHWDRHKSSPDIHAMKMRSRTNEVKIISDIAGLGAFLVLEMTACP
jgi:hypothetical protein